MSQVAIINKLRLERAKSTNADTLLELAEILDIDNVSDIFNMGEEEINNRISKKIDEIVGKGSLPRNIVHFTREYSNGTIDLDMCDPIPHMIKEICKNESAILLVIDKK